MPSGSVPKNAPIAVLKISMSVLKNKYIRATVDVPIDMSKKTLKATKEENGLRL